MKNFRFLKQPSVDEASMERRWSVDGARTLSMENQSPRNGRIAELQNCTTGKMRYFARIAAMLLMLLTLGVGNVWALGEGNWFAISNRPYVYFDNSKTQWNDVSLFLGRQWTYDKESIGSYGQNMTHITNTQLWVVQSNDEAHMTTLAFFGVKDWGWKNNEKVSERAGYTSDKYTNSYNSGLNGGYHLYTPASGSADASLSKTTLSGGYSDLNKKQTVKVMISTNGGASYSEASQYYGTIKASRYALSNATTANNSEKTLAYGDSYASGVITSSITFTASATNTGYTFMGWGESPSATPDGNTSKTYTVSDAKTIYAFYKLNHYSVNYGLVTGCDGMGTFEARCGDDWESGSVVASGSNLPHGTHIMFQVTSTTEGYEYLGIYSDNAGNSRFVEPAYSGTAWDMAAAAAAYAKFRPITYNITYNLNGGSGASNSTYTIESADITLPTAPTMQKDGYTFVGWYTNSGFTGEPVTAIAHGSTGNKEYWAKWEENAAETYTIHFGKTNTSTGNGSVTARTSNGRDLNDGDEFTECASITFTATPELNSKFVQWYGGVDESGDNHWTENPFTYGNEENHVTYGISHYAKFKALTYRMTLNNGTFEQGSVQWTEEDFDWNGSAWTQTRTINNTSGGDLTYTFAIASDKDDFANTKLQNANVDVTGAVKRPADATDFQITLPAGTHKVVFSYVPTDNTRGTLTVTRMYPVNFGVVGEHGSVAANIMNDEEVGDALTSGDEVAMGTEVRFVASPASGYEVEHWHGNAGGTGDGFFDEQTAVKFAVNAPANMYAQFRFVPKTIYVVGKFKIKDPETGNYTFNGSSDGDWQTGNGNIWFDYDTEEQLYKLETHCTVSDLMGSTGYYFHFRENNTEYGDAKDGGNSNPPTSMPGDANVKSGSANFKFSSGSGDDVVLWMDWDSKKFWYTYTPETTYEITLTGATEASVQAGKTPVTITANPASGYDFVEWQTTGGATVANPNSATTTVTATATGTVTAIFARSSGWYLQGQIDGQSKWEVSTKDWPLNRSYRGIDGIYYRQATVNNEAYFGIHDGKNKYSGHSDTNNDYNYGSSTGKITLVQNSKKSFKATSQFSNKWFVVNTDTKQFWIQDPVATYYDVTVTGATEHGSYTLLDNTTDGPVKGTACEKYSANDTYLLTVTVDGCYIPALKVNGETTAWTSVDGNVYTYQAQPTAATTLAVAYSEETKYTVTITAGAYGTITTPAAPATTVLAGSCTSADIVATPAQYFYFNGWTPSANVTLADAEAATTMVNATADGTVTANFLPSWSVRGNYNTNWEIANYIENYDGNTGYVDIELAAGTHEFKVFHHNGSIYGNSGTMTRDGQSVQTGGWTMATDKDNCQIKADVAGTYRFTFNVGTKKLTVTYPEAYSVTFGRGTVKGGAAATAAITDGAALTRGDYVVPSTSVTFTAGAASDGYNYLGWFDNESGTGDALTTEATYVTTVSANTTVYAIYAPINYTITYVVNGGDEIAARNYDVTTATFDLPTPTKTGYAFRGWYEDAEFTSEVTQVERGSTGNKTFYAKWKQEGWYVHYQGDDDKWHDRFFSGEPQTATITGLTQEAHNYPMEIVKVQAGQADAYYKNANWMTSTNADAIGDGWTYVNDATQRHGFTSTIAGNYKFVIKSFNSNNEPKVAIIYPQWSCAFNIPAVNNTLQSSTVSFTPNVVNYDVTGYELYYTNDGGANWTSCVGVSESAGVYSYNNTFTTDGTYQLKVVVKNGDEQVGEPFLSSEFTVVAPTIELSVSSYPRAGQTVTVTPTVTGVSGTYYYCWSLLKNGEAQDVSITRDGETNNWTFTAPEAGDYTLRLEVKPGNDCSASAIIRKDQELEILGNSILVKMKRDPYTYWELNNYIYYYKNETENAEWPGAQMTYLGKDEEGFPWYSFVIDNFNTYNRGTLVFNENKQDKNASQTQDIAMPQTDACYFVSASLNNEWKRKATLLQECPDTEARVLLTSATTNLYQNVTYTVKAQVVFLPGDEFVYSCTITDPSSQTVTLDEHNSFIPSAVGTYHIVLRATNEVGTYAETAYDLDFAANPITLALSQGKTIGLDNVITLTTSSTQALNDTYKYTYTVIEPGTHDEVTFQKATTDAKTSSNYTMRSTGTYLFFVHITDASGNTVGRAQYKATVATMKCWIKHNWNGGSNNGDWVWHEMTYRQDGTYKYYNNTGDANTISAYRGDNGANVVMQMDQPASDAEGNYITINNPYNLTQSAEAVVYIYDAAANTLEVRPAGGTTVYRIKSTCSNGVYYSNTVNNTTEKLSFYAQKNGSLQWQSRQGTADDWNDGTVISTDKITQNTVYQATIKTLGAADGLVTCKAYTGAYYVYTAAAPNASAQMTAFTKSPLQSNEYYNHYYTVHQTDNCNLMATVGNAINHNLSVVLPYYKLPREANVRYGYDDETNLFVRACIDNSTTQDFLMLYGNNLSTTAQTQVVLNGSDNSHMLKLTDVSDWIYTCTVRTTMASENPVPTKACLRTVFDGKETWILAASGLESDEDAQVELLNDRTTSAGTYDLNIIYDYKTNRLVAGWTPAENTIFDEPIMVDQMLITRVGDGAATQFEIQESNARQNEILVVKQMTLEFVFNKSEWTSSWSSTNGSVFYWISVPYECRVSDIFGLGAYKGKWEIQDYRGDMLAKGTAGSTPWRVLNLTSTMKPNHGYVLRFFGLEEGDFKTVGELSAIRMYFPSHQSVELTTQPVTELPVNENAKTHPSQWDWCVAGVPLMKSGGLVENVLPRENPNETAQLESYYKWSWAAGERWYEPVLFSGYDKEPMLSTHGYMVQGIGSLVWTYPTNISTPSPVQARRAAVSTTNMNIRLDLLQEGAYQDRAYVLYREDASREFELGRDLPKIENAGRSMVWSAMDHNLATNVIADDDYELIPLTVVAAENGEYTIHLNYMEGGDDVQPILYDAVEGTTTMMRYQDHTIELNAGKYENRFFVGLQKSPATPTDMGTTDAEQGGVEKFINERGELRIVRDGHIFDATGRQIK